MISESLNITGTTIQRPHSPSEQVDTGRKKVSEDAGSSGNSAPQKRVQPEELLNKIKAITDNGMYSVRFENDRTTKQLVVKIVDSNTNEVIRQIPPESLLGLRETLNDFKGNIVNATS
jgi:flagellar protein FlaG